MLNTLYIDWQPNVEIFNLFGYSVRWYAMGWIMSILVPYFIVRWLYKDQGIDPVLDKKGKWVETGKFDPLVFYCFCPTGALHLLRAKLFSHFRSRLGGDVPAYQVR